MDSYNKEIVWKFYASYVSTLRGSIDKREKSAKQYSITYKLVRASQVEISETTICHVLYGPTTGSQWSRCFFVCLHAED